MAVILSQLVVLEFVICATSEPRRLKGDDC